MLDWTQFYNQINKEASEIRSKEPPQRSPPIESEKKVVCPKNCATVQVKDKNQCPNCGKDTLHVSNYNSVCHSCGFEKPVYSESGAFNMTTLYEHTGTKKSKVPFKLMGKSAGEYKDIFQTICSGSTLSVEEEKKHLIDLNDKFEWGKKLSSKTINLAVDMFYKIKQSGYSFRGDNSKMSVIGACLYYACITHHDARSTKAISKFLNVDVKLVSKRQKFLRELHADDVIQIQISFDPMEDYINQYFYVLKIPKIYEQFVIDLINRAEAKYIHLQCDCKISTKCVGAIYMLTTRIPSLRDIKKDTISKECHISKSTFVKYYNLLNEHYKRLKNVFKRHHIPMDPSWKK